MQDLRAVRLCASDSAFAALQADGEVVCWGDIATATGCSEAVALCSCEGSFAALRRDGTAVSWGRCDSLAVQPWLQNVKELSATKLAFAALRHDGHVVAWGPWYAGGQLDKELTEVQEVVGTHLAFAARTKKGTVHCWGSPKHGGDCRQVEDGLRTPRFACFWMLWASFMSDFQKDSRLFHGFSMDVR